MKAVLSENEVVVVPEDANEEFALRQWNKNHETDEPFILVMTSPLTFNDRYRFNKYEKQE